MNLSIASVHPAETSFFSHNAAVDTRNQNDLLAPEASKTTLNLVSS